MNLVVFYFSFTASFLRRWQVLVSFTSCMTLGFNELRIDRVMTMAHLTYHEPNGISIPRCI
jgi:hypothetical protein